MISQNCFDHDLQQVIYGIIPEITVKNCSTIVTAYSRYGTSVRTTKHVLEILSQSNMFCADLSKHEIRLLKLMIIYIYIASDASFLDDRNKHQNAQLAYSDLLSYKSLSNKDRDMIYGAIVSTIKKDIYFTDNNLPPVVNSFLQVHTHFLCEPEKSNTFISDINYRTSYLSGIISTVLRHPYS